MSHNWNDLELTLNGEPFKNAVAFVHWNCRCSMQQISPADVIRSLKPRKTIARLRSVAEIILHKHNLN